MSSRPYWETTLAGLDVGGGTFLGDIIARKIIKALESIEPDHFVVFDEKGWFVEHSLSCRLDGTLGTCDYNAAIRAVADEPNPEDFGRWRITSIDSEGLPSLDRASLESGDGMEKIDE
jgi:hypothetical protein